MKKILCQSFFKVMETWINNSMTLQQNMSKIPVKHIGCSVHVTVKLLSCQWNAPE